MRRKACFRWGLFAGLAFVGLLLGYAAAVPSDEPAKVPDEAAKPAGDGVLFPPDRAVLLSASFDVICRSEQTPLEIDGRPREWEPFEPPVHVAHVRLAPGVHELRIGPERHQFAVALNELEHEGPEDWPIYRSHEMNRGEDRCGDCHQTAKQEGRIAVGEPKSFEACFACHPPVEFEAIHSHPLEPIQHCQMCHSLHGSTRKGLLKAPVKQLCADCHDV